MNTNTEHQQSEREIFTAASDISSETERIAYLDAACSGRPQLRTRIDRLLANSGEARDFLEHPPAGLSLTLFHEDGSPAQPDCESLPFLSPNEKPGCMGTIGHYEVVGIIGRGAFGIVLRAYDTKLNRVVAVKVIAPELALNQTAVKRFSREARAAAAVIHDHVITLHAIDESASPPFLVMEFVEGESLATYIEREGPLDTSEILRIGMQIASGLSAAHKLGLVHRDIKPANILLENGIRRVKITDFGLARAVDDIGMTQTGTIAGTPQYMSPEQCMGMTIDARSDLFSLGSVLYTLCAGRAPFRADSTVATLKRVCDDEPRNVCGINQDIPNWLNDLVMKLLAKDPDNRYQSAEEVSELLRGCLADLQAGPVDQVPKAFRLSQSARSLMPATRREVPPLLFRSICVQTIALVVSLVAAWINVESILFTGPVFAVGLGCVITCVAYATKAPIGHFLFGLSSIAFALTLTTAIHIFHWGPGDKVPILGMVTPYCVFAILWGTVLWNKYKGDPGFPEPLAELVQQREFFEAVMGLHILGIGITASLATLASDSVWICLPTFFLLTGIGLSLLVLKESERHVATKIFAVSAPIFALLALFSLASYAASAPGTSIAAFGQWTSVTLIVAYATIAIPVGLWCLVAERQNSVGTSRPRFSIKAGLIVTMVIAMAIAFARPSLGFGSLAFFGASLLGVALFSLAGILAHHFYQRRVGASHNTHLFGVAIATLVVAVTFMLSVSQFDQAQNYSTLTFRIEGMRQLPRPISINITDTYTGQTTTRRVVRDREHLGRFHVGTIEVELADSSEYKIAEPKINLRRPIGEITLTVPEGDNSAGEVGDASTGFGLSPQAPAPFEAENRNQVGGD